MGDHDDRPVPAASPLLSRPTRGRVARAGGKRDRFHARIRGAIGWRRGHVGENGKDVQRAVQMIFPHHPPCRRPSSRGVPSRTGSDGQSVALLAAVGALAMMALQACAACRAGRRGLMSPASLNCDEEEEQQRERVRLPRIAARSETIREGEEETNVLHLMRTRRSRDRERALGVRAKNSYRGCPCRGNCGRSADGDRVDRPPLLAELLGSSLRRRYPAAARLPLGSRKSARARLHRLERSAPHLEAVRFPELRIVRWIPGPIRKGGSSHGPGSPCCARCRRPWDRRPRRHQFFEPRHRGCESRAGSCRARLEESEHSKGRPSRPERG